MLSLSLVELAAQSGKMDSHSGKDSIKHVPCQGADAT